MAITVTSATYSVDQPQVDGRSVLTVTVTLSNGAQEIISLLVDANANYQALATSIGNDWLAGLAVMEIANNIAAVSSIGSLAAPVFVYTTAAQNAAALRQVYATMTQTQAVMSADYLATLTNAQLMAAFGLTLTQVQTLRTNKLTPAVSLAASIRSSTGA